MGLTPQGHGEPWRGDPGRKRERCPCPQKLRMKPWGHPAGCGPLTPWRPRPEVQLQPPGSQDPNPTPEGAGQPTGSLRPAPPGLRWGSRSAWQTPQEGPRLGTHLCTPNLTVKTLVELQPPVLASHLGIWGPHPTRVDTMLTGTRGAWATSNSLGIAPHMAPGRPQLALPVPRGH